MSQIPLKSKIWRILKPMLTYDIILFLVTLYGRSSADDVLPGWAAWRIVCTGRQR